MTTIASPCVNICQLDAKGEACLGCGRTLAEIAGWLAMSNEERAAIMTRTAARKSEPHG